MEIRNIDPQDQSKITLHAGALGTAKTVHVRQLRHGSLPQQSPAPNPFQHLIERALEDHHAECADRTGFPIESGGDASLSTIRPDSTRLIGHPRSESSQNAGEVDHRHPTSHELSPDFDGPPATHPYFVQKDDSGNEVWWSPKSKSYEVKDRAGIAGNNPVTTDASKQVGYVGSVLRLRSGQPTSSTQRAPAPDSHHNAEIVRTDSRGSPRESQSAPGNPAPNCNHQNADSTGDVSQLAISSRNIAVLPRRSAPHSSDGTHGIGLHCSPVGRCLRSLIGFLRKLSVKIGNKSAYHDPSKARVNGRWVRREVYEKYR